MKIIDAHIHYSPQTGPEFLTAILDRTGTDGAVIQAVSHSRCLSLIPGALVMKDEHVKHRIDLLKNFGIKNEEEVVMPGINGKLDEVRAAIGRIMLNYVEAERQKRFRLHEIYNEELGEVDGLKLMPKCADNVKLNYQYYVIRIDEKIFGKSRKIFSDDSGISR